MCVLIKDIRRRLPVELQCSLYQGQQGDVYIYRMYVLPIIFVGKTVGRVALLLFRFFLKRVFLRLRGIELLKTDSTIAPPQNQRFSKTDVSRMLDTRKDARKAILSLYVLVCNGLSDDDVGVARDAVSEENWPGASFKTDDFGKEKLGRLP